MKKLLSLIFAVVVFVGIFTSTSSAENFIWGQDYRTITVVYPDTDFQFYLSGTTIDPNSSCPNRFVIWHTDGNYEIKVASLLTAFQNGDLIQVKFDNDATGCATNVIMFKVQPQ